MNVIASLESHQLTEELLGESLSSAINQWSQDPDDDLVTQLGILLWERGQKRLFSAVQGLSRPVPRFNRPVSYHTIFKEVPLLFLYRRTFTYKF